MNKPIISGLIVLIGCTVAVSQLLLRHGVRQLGQERLTLSWGMALAALSSPWILASLALSAVVFVSYGYLLSRADMTLAAPAVNGVFYLVIFAVAAVWLRESVTPGRAAGAALLLVAMWLLSRSTR